MPKQPNVVFVFADQWRAQATGYAGCADVQTPHLDALSQQSIQFAQAISGCPVCTPYRASLLTGQRPRTHGLFLNDLSLSDDAVSIAEAFSRAGYDTAYVGKWHVDGHGRLSYIPPERRQGFQHWRVQECTHDYNHSDYFADTDERLWWDGYDAAAQTREARRYIREHDGERPFFLVLSWAPPHDPYLTAPEEFRALYNADDIRLRPNVPGEHERARRDLAGYYAHCSALDACVGELLATLDETGLADDTVFVFTSDHGDLVGSHGWWNKQQPWEESIQVPFLLRWPGGLGCEPHTADALLDAPDIMPTLLGLCGIDVPETVEGTDLSPALRGEGPAGDDAVLLACYAPFGQFKRSDGGREFRGVRTRRHTYVRDLDGPWLLFDNESDPYQLENLVDKPEHAALQAELEAVLTRMLAARKDEFLPGADYIARWGYEVGADGTVLVHP
jgi:arylsulfatase A-like enzyme